MRNKYFYALFAFLSLVYSGVFAQDLTPGIKMIERERYSDAETFFNEEINKNPKDADAYFYLGKIQALRKNNSGAQELFQRGLNADKDNSLDLIGSAIFNAFESKTDISEPLGAILEDAADRSVCLMNIADMYVILNYKDITAPKKLLDAEAHQDKKDPSVYTALGKLMLFANDPNGAISNYQSAIDWSKNNYEAFTAKGIIYTRIKDFSGAEASFISAFAADSLYSPAYREAAEMYYAMKQYDKAVANYKKYIELSDPSAEKRNRFAILLYAAGKYADASAYINGFSYNEKTPAIKRILALSYYYADDGVNGIKAYGDYISSADAGTVAQNDFEYYAKLLAKAGADSLAILNYKRAIELDSSDYTVHGDLAIIYYKKKMWRDCASEYEKKIALLNAASKKPGVQDYFDMGKACYFDKQYEKADTSFAMLISLRPDLPAGYFWRARTKSFFDPESEQGLAKPYYEKFVELAQADVEKNKKDLIEAYCYLGYYYYLTKDNPVSLEFWNKVSSLDPENEQAKEALKSIK